MITWEYVAGLFDGEGSCNLGIYSTNTRRGVSLGVVISSITLNALLDVKSFLRQNEITCCIYKSGKGSLKCQVYHLEIQGNDSMLRFIDAVLPFSLMKKEVLSVLQEAIELKTSIKESGGKIYENFESFDKLRKRLHGFTTKGPRTLGPLSSLVNPR